MEKHELEFDQEPVVVYENSAGNQTHVYTDPDKVVSNGVEASVSPLEAVETAIERDWDIVEGDPSNVPGSEAVTGSYGPPLDVDTTDVDARQHRKAKELRERHQRRQAEAANALADVPDPEEHKRQRHGVAPERQLDEAAGAWPKSIRTVDRDNPKEMEQFREMMEKGASNVSDVIDAEPAQASLDGEEENPQATFNVDPDTRESQGRESRHEAEKNMGGLEADRRDDADRGAENSQPETEQRKFADPEQSSLSDL